MRSKEKHSDPGDDTVQWLREELSLIETATSNLIQEIRRNNVLGDSESEEALDRFEARVKELTGRISFEARGGRGTT